MTRCGAGGLGRCDDGMWGRLSHDSGLAPAFIRLVSVLLHGYGRHDCFTYITINSSVQAYGRILVIWFPHDFVHSLQPQIWLYYTHNATTTYKTHAPRRTTAHMSSGYTIILGHWRLLNLCVPSFFYQPCHLSTLFRGQRLIASGLCKVPLWYDSTISQQKHHHINIPSLDCMLQRCHTEGAVISTLVNLRTAMKQ